MSHVPLMSKTVNVEKKLFIMKKFQDSPSPRRAPVTKVELHNQSQQHTRDTKDSGSVNWVSEREVVIVHL